MALPKKGTRKISIEGQTYCWIVSGNDGYIDVIVCSATKQGQKLLAQFNYHTPNVATGTQNASQIAITPKIISKVIEFGLKSGWKPSEKIADLRLSFMDDKIVFDL